MNRAVFHRLGLSVGIAIALASCAQTVERDLECIRNATGEKFTAKAGTKTSLLYGQDAIPVRDKDGFTMWVRAGNLDLWRCRSVGQ